MAFCKVEKSGYLTSYNRIDCIEGAEHNNVVIVDFRIREIKIVVRVIFIKDVFSIVVVVKECQ